MFNRIIAALLAFLLPAAALAQPTAEPNDAVAIVQKQVEAYNRGDAEAFASFYAEDAELFDLGPNAVPIMSGRQALIPHYRSMFEKYQPQVQIVARIVNGDYVVDHERVTGKGHTMEAVAIYQVEKGKIRRVWFTN